MASAATTVDEYLEELAAADPDRHTTVHSVIELIRAHIPDGFAEAMEFGMPSWVIPLSDYPDTYNGRPLGIVSIANQKRAVSVYLMGVYADPNGRDRFEQAWTDAGKKLDMGKSCVRFRRMDDVAVEVLADAIASVTPDQYIAAYEASRQKPSS